MDSPAAGLDFAGLAGLRVVGDGPDAAGEDVGDLLEGEVGVDAVSVAGLDVALGQGEAGAGGDVDGGRRRCRRGRR